MILTVFPSENYPGEINVALDDLLARQEIKPGRAFVRFFGWSDSCITIGRTVPQAQAFAASICHPGAKLLRRSSGGGIVVHGDQMSLSFGWPRDRVLKLRSLQDSCLFIHGAVQKALKDCGYSTKLVTREEAQPGLMCSSSLAESDLVNEAGGKVLGGAQWRGSGFCLYQGHLWLRGMPALEEHIAYWLAELLGAKLCQGVISKEQLDAAAETGHKWLVTAEAA